MRAEREKQYIAIDLKSFYASVEAAERGFDPLDVMLVVADESRTEKTICLAVSPALKALGVPGRARLFEALERVRAVNGERLRAAPGRRFTGKTCFASELAADPSLELEPVIARPRMRYYMDYSRKVVEIYLRHVSPDDLLVYSIDEVFIDATPYLRGGVTAHDFAMKLIREVLAETRVTATAGIGTNLYLAKVAMDVVAKHIPPDRDGVRIAALDEQGYREQLWDHTPLTDFWRVGRGIARQLERRGLRTMGDVARCSADPAGEALLFRLFGVNAELLIDHAWGWEPTEIADCRAYQPESKSLSQGQVLARPYTAEEGRTIVREMAEGMAMQLVQQELTTDQVVLAVAYDVENLRDPGRAGAYAGPVERDRYGRETPKSVNGSQKLGKRSSAASRIVGAACAIYDRIVDPSLLVRRVSIAVTRLLPRSETPPEAEGAQQLDLFTDYEAEARRAQTEAEAEAREHRMQKALLDIRGRFGGDAIVRGLNLREEATALERGHQVGGHRE